MPGCGQPQGNGSRDDRYKNHDEGDFVASPSVEKITPEIGTEGAAKAKSGGNAIAGKVVQISLPEPIGVEE